MKNTADSETPSSLVQKILDCSLNGVMFYRSIRDENGNIVDFRLSGMNSIAQAALPVNKDEALGRTLLEIFPISGKVGVLDRYREVVLTGQPAHFETSFRLPGNQHTSHLEISAVRLDDGLVMSYLDVSAQRQTEQSLLSQGYLLESLLKHSLSGIAVLQPILNEFNVVQDFRILLVNETITGWVGKTKNEIYQSTLRQIFPTTEHEGQFANYVKVYETETPYLGQHYYPTFDLWLELEISRISEGVIVLYHDITARKNAELERLRQSHLITQVINSVQSGIMVCHPIYNENNKIIDFRFTLLNEEAIRMAGRARENIMKSTFRTLDPKGSNRLVFDYFVYVQNTGQPKTFDYLYPGINRWFRVSVSSFDDGIVISFFDCTEQKQLQLEREQTAEMLQGVLNGSLNSIVVYEAKRDNTNHITDFCVRLFNDAALVFFEHSADDLMGKCLTELYPATKEHGMFSHCVKVLETGRPERITLDYPEHDLSVELAISRYGDGVIVGSSDVTRLRRYQRELEWKNQELLRSNANLQQFAYVASHDLQEPLRKIQSFGDVLQQQYAANLPNDATDLLQRMQSAARRMAGLIQDLLTYSRISTQQQPFRLVSLQKLVSEVFSDLEMTIREKNAFIHVDELPQLAGDPLQLRQLFQNLISNALKFTPLGQSPKILIHCKQVVGINQKSLTDNLRRKPFYQIDVTDNGIGFDEKYLDRIFQVFQRLHGKNSYSGTGIGLAICKKVVENHHGFITATSQPGHGATFTVFLPVTADIPSAANKS